MTWSELVNQPRTITPWDEQRKWIEEAKEFGNKYNVIIRLKALTDRCGEILIIEMSHPNDPKNIVRYKKNGGTYISPRDRISGYFEHLYGKLPIVRRKKFIKESENQRRLEDLSKDFN